MIFALVELHSSLLLYRKWGQEQWVLPGGDILPFVGNVKADGTYWIGDEKLEVAMAGQNSVILKTTIPQYLAAFCNLHTDTTDIVDIAQPPKFFQPEEIPLVLISEHRILVDQIILAPKI